MLARCTTPTLLFPDFSLILLGYLLCRHTALGRGVWQAVEQLVYFLLFPVLLFQSIVRTPLDLHAASSLMAPAWPWAPPASPWPMPCPSCRAGPPHRRGATTPPARRSRSASTPSSAWPWPSAWPAPQGLQLMAVLIGVCVPLFNVAAVWPMARHAAAAWAASWCATRSSSPRRWGWRPTWLGLDLPAWLAPTLSRIGAASIALGLMAAGAGMQLQSLARAKALGVSALLTIRHLLLALVAWLLARALGLGTAETTALLVFSALPTSSSCYVLAARMGYNGAYVAGLVTLSTLLALLSLPWAFLLLERLAP
jgi:malonate transporter